MRATPRGAGRTPRTTRSGCAKLPCRPNSAVKPPAPRSLRDLRHLTPAAVNLHAVEVVRRLLPRLDALAVGPSVVASGARVALADEIGALLGARMVAVLIGERPGLSAPDSLGAYLTFAPAPGRTDAERNCVSNIHASGLGYDEAAFRIAWLIREGLARQLTGVALKDESALQARLPRESTSPAT